MDSSKNKLIWIILVSLLCFNIIVWVWVWDLNRPRFLEVTFFDVGQGDSIFIETSNKYQVLIDGGPSSSILLEKLGKAMPFYDRTIDLIILTHPESDHYKGLFEVLERYKIENILWTGILRDTNEWQEWMSLIEKEGVEIKIAEAGQRIILDNSSYIDILHPFKKLEGQEIKNSNDSSIVAYLSFNNISFLFTGDIAKKTELELIKKDIKADVLKVAHHGSKTSSSIEFLEAVLPDIAVIQVGKDNSYGHPHLEVLANLEQFGIEVLRTDKIGDIRIISDGDNYRIKTQLNY